MTIELQSKMLLETIDQFIVVLNSQKQFYKKQNLDPLELEFVNSLWEDMNKRGDRYIINNEGEYFTIEPLKE